MVVAPFFLSNFGFAALGCSTEQVLYGCLMKDLDQIESIIAI